MKNTESSSVLVQWDKADDSLTTTYIVTWTNEKDMNDFHSHILIEQSSYTITGLTLNTIYTITVTAANRCSQRSEYRASVSLTTVAISSISTATVLLQ